MRRPTAIAATALCFALVVTAACADFIAPISSGGETCARTTDCGGGRICHKGVCLTRCGDGIVQAGEGCDDGNRESFDACTWLCVPARCGDGFVHVGVEACDDGDEDNLDGCSTNCQLSYCGDGIQRTDLSEGQAGYEACDDGDRRDDNACTANCLLNVCGDGLLWSLQEDCDDGNTDDGDDCLNSCQLARCGDGVVRTDLALGEEGYEACDDGNLVDQGDGCSNSCERADCGDGIVFAGNHAEDPRREECDDGNRIDDDGCRNSCVLARCGDGIIRRDLGPEEEGYEACDDGDGDDINACSNSCRGTMCGDGEINRNESCDDGNRVGGDGCPAGCGAAVIQLESHRYGTCALLERGWVYCWGANYLGSLGFEPPNRAVPSEMYLDSATRLPEVENAIKLVNSGQDRFCALLADGGAQCWGRNQRGLLGVGLDPDFFASSTPLRVLDEREEPLEDLVDLDCSLNGCCAVHQAGDISCWGADTGGLSRLERDYSQVRAVAVGDWHRCVLMGDEGEVACAGDNLHGQLGQGNTEDSEEPVVVPGLPNMAKLYAFGDNSCGISISNELWCWGEGDRLVSARPGTRSWWADSVGDLWGSRSRWGDRRVASEDLGCSEETSHCLSPVHLEAYGTVLGLRNESGFWPMQETTYVRQAETGHWLRLPSHESIEAETVTASVRTATHAHQRCELDESGVVRCHNLGRGISGLEGSGRPSRLMDPTLLDHLPPVREFYPGGRYGINCIIDQEDQIHCWGSNGSDGRFGDPDFADEWTDYLHRVPNLEDVQAMRVLYQSGCALHGDGVLSCWGRNNSYHMGIGGDPSPGRVPRALPLEDVHQFETTQTKAHGTNAALCAIAGEERRIFCAGANGGGQLGNGVPVNSFDVFEMIPGLSNVEKIALSYFAGCAIGGDGQLSCWGTSASLLWQFGEETQTFSLPTELPGLDNVIDFALSGSSNYRHRFRAVQSSGGLINFGHGISENSSAPLRVPNNVVQACGAIDRDCVLTSDDEVWCWGSNATGAMGRRQDPQLLSPVVNTPVGISKLICGATTSCVIHGQGQLSCWGMNLAPLDPDVDPYRVVGLEAPWRP